MALYGSAAFKVLKPGVIRELSIALGLGAVGGLAWKTLHWSERAAISDRNKAWEQQKAEFRKNAGKE